MKNGMNAARPIRLMGTSAYGHSDEEIAQDNAVPGDPLDDRPRSVYEIVTRQMLDELKNSVAEIKNRVNTLLWLVVGAVVLEMVTRLVK